MCMDDLFRAQWILSQRECVAMISACADELSQVYDYWQKTELKND